MLTYTYVTRTNGERVLNDYAILQAGGNMGGDCDQQDRPVVEGAFYVVQIVPEAADHMEDAYIVAGPFSKEEYAQTWINTSYNPWIA